MKYIFLSAIISVFVLSSSCKKSKTETGSCSEPQLDCSTILCIAHWNNFDFKLSDKASGTDLVFGSNPRYTTSEVKLFANAARTIEIGITADMANKKFQCMTAINEMYLEVKGTVYNLTATFRKIDCCVSRVKSISIKGTLICDCCPNIVNVPVD